MDVCLWNRTGKERKEGAGMAKIVIGSLGITEYHPVAYKLDETSSYSSRYCISAIAQHIKPDKVILLLTPEAKSKHFESVAEELRDVGIETVPIAIAIGANQADLWKNFDAIAEGVQSGDTIYFDITNAFRSLPLIFMSAMEYLRRARNAHMEGIYYGAFEAGTSRSSSVSSSPEEIPTVPVFSLELFLTLSDWAHAVEIFQKSGDGVALAELLQHFDLDHQLAKDLLSAIAQSLRHYSLALSLIRPIEVMNEAHLLIEAIDSFINLPLEDTHFPAPFRELLQMVRLDCSPFALPKQAAIKDIPQNLKGQLCLIDWLHQHSRLYDVCVMASEWIVSWTMWASGKFSNGDLFNQGKRSNCKGWLNPLHVDKGNLPTQIHGIESKYVSTLYNNVSNKRNDLAHCGWDAANRDESADIVKKIEDTIDGIHTLGGALSTS